MSTTMEHILIAAIVLIFVGVVHVMTPPGGVGPERRGQ